MTYNFDPDKWFDNEFLQLQSKLKRGEISQDAFDEAVEILENRLEEMWQHLDGSYQITPDNSRKINPEGLE